MCHVFSWHAEAHIGPISIILPGSRKHVKQMHKVTVPQSCKQVLNKVAQKNSIVDMLTMLTSTASLMR